MLRAVAILTIALLGACQDPCVALAQRICGCEPTSAARLACERERVDTLRGQQEPSESELEVCAAALDTCSCDALDENRTDLCAFTREASE